MFELLGEQSNVYLDISSTNAYEFLKSIHLFNPQITFKIYYKEIGKANSSDLKLVIDNKFISKQPLKEIAENIKMEFNLNMLQSFHKEIFKKVENFLIPFHFQIIICIYQTPENGCQNDSYLNIYEYEKGKVKTNSEFLSNKFIKSTSFVSYGYTLNLNFSEQNNIFTKSYKIVNNNLHSNSMIILINYDFPFSINEKLKIKFLKRFIKNSFQKIKNTNCKEFYSEKEDKVD